MPCLSSVSTRPATEMVRLEIGGVDVEHVGDVAIAVAALAQLGVAIDVDPPVEHRLAGEAQRRHPQQLDHPARRLGISVGGGIMDRQLHQPNLNCRAIA